MMKRLHKLAFAAALLGAAVTVAEKAEAQEIQLTGPLAGAGSHKHLRLYRKGRLELAPTVSFTLLDEYRRTILTGAKIQYNVTDWFAVGVWGAYGAISSSTDLTDQVADVNTARRGSNSSVAEQNAVSRTAVNMTSGDFRDQTAKIQWTAAPQVQLVPFRGKMALFQKIFVDADAYLHGGLAFVGLQERGHCAAGSCTAASSFDLQSRMAIAPTFGLGFTFYPSNFVSFGFEYRAMPFSWNRAGFDTRGSSSDFPDNAIDSNDSTFKFNQMVSIHVGFSLPTKPQISN